MTSFLEQFARDLLDQHGLGALSEEKKKPFVQELVGQAQERIGLELLPRLNDQQLNAFDALMNDPETTPEQWNYFWNHAIEDAPNTIAQILKRFADDFSQLIQE